MAANPEPIPAYMAWRTPPFIAAALDELESGAKAAEDRQGYRWSMLEAAMRHVKRGRPVFPCSPANKAPMTSRGFRDASLDPELVRRWFDQRNPPMIGLPTGGVTGLVVLDLDSPLGLESLLDLERDHGPLPRTASATTPSGGEHRYFTSPAGGVPCSAGKIAPGVDLRGEGGYVIAPPSRRFDGRAYEVEVEAKPAPMPSWLLELARDRRPALDPADVGLVPVGRRHEAMVSLAGLMRSWGASEEVLVAAGLAFLRHQCAVDPATPIDLQAAERSLRSIAAYPPAVNRETR